MKKKQYTPPVYIGQNLYIKPSYIVSLPEFHYEEKQRSVRFEDNKANLLQNQHHGKLSPKAVTSIRNAINWLCISARKKKVFSRATGREWFFKVSFITLTLPDTDVRICERNFQKQLLNPFLVYLRKYHNLKNYVWKLEYQANGKLHCHVTIDCFIHWRTVRKIWNRVLKSNGHLSKFERTHGHSDPNSTDIHSVRKIRDLAKYLSKYMAKTQELKITHEGQEYWYTPVINGRIWSCSYELSRAKNCRVHIPASELKENLSCLFQKGIEWKDLMRTNPVTQELTKVGEIFYLKASDWYSKITGTISQAFNEVRQMIAGPAQHFKTYEIEF